METKYIIFAVALVFGVPLATFLAYLRQKFQDSLAAVMVAATSFRTGPTDIELINRDWYRGTTVGTEFTVVDLSALALLFSILLRRSSGQRKGIWPASFGFVLIYIGYCIFSVSTSDPWLFGFFELTKIIRGAFVFYVIYLYVKGEREIKVLLIGLAATVLFLCYLSLDERYMKGVWRSIATLIHPNMLSMYCCIAAPVLMAGALAKIHKHQRLLFGAGALASILCVLLTVSRTGFVVVVACTIGVGILSMHRINIKTLGYAAVGAIALSGLFISGSDSVMVRFELGTDVGEGGTVMGDRDEYWFFAARILENHFWGCGLNNWSYYVTNEVFPLIGITRGRYIGTDQPPIVTFIKNEDIAAPAHSMAAITLGELGVPGLVLFTCMWGRWVQIGYTFIFKRTSALASRYGIGCMVGLGGCFLQGFTEWAYRHSSIFFLTHILLGALTALYSMRSRAPLRRI